LYADSGFGDAVLAGRGYSLRASIPPTTTMMEQLIEDRLVGPGSKPDATVRTGARTPWTMATVVFRTAAGDRAYKPSRGSGTRGVSQRPAALARSAQHGNVEPLSSRPRPHIVAGGIAQLITRVGGRAVRFYCLVDPSGKAIWGARENSSIAWLQPKLSP
jgi:hypothetical protein